MVEIGVKWRIEIEDRLKQRPKSCQRKRTIKSWLVDLSLFVLLEILVLFDVPLL